jgi:flagellar biosynthesis protein FlhA
MSDTTTVESGETTLSRLADFGTMLRRGDIGLALGIMTILVILILPLPPILLDFALAVSITFAVLILMTSLFIQTPLQFSAFPTVLLTMLRLSLNLASTRLILGHGHEGTAAAGHVIEAFGNFVIGWSSPRARAVSPKSRRVSTWTACPASRWRSTPTSMPA